MKEFIRLCGIAACTLLLLTGCSSKYERDDEPGRVENITVAKMQEMVDKKESFAIVFTQTTCSHCIEFKKMLDGYLLDHNVVLYDVVLDEAPASQRKSDLNTIRKTFPGMKIKYIKKVFCIRDVSCYNGILFYGLLFKNMRCQRNHKSRLL